MTSSYLTVPRDNVNLYDSVEAGKVLSQIQSDPDFLLESTVELGKNLLQSTGDPSLQNTSQSIDLSVSHCAINASNKTFETELGASMEYITSLAKFTLAGDKFVHMLYTFRSISRVIPMAPSNAPEELNENILQIMEQEMNKLKELIDFVNNFLRVLNECILFITDSHDTRNVNESVYDVVVAALDLIMKLDFLKDAKSSLINDFTRYKRLKLLAAKSQGPDVTSSINQELERLQMFLSNTDPTKAKNYIYLTLRSEVKRIPNHEKALITILEYAMECNVKNLFMTPDEKHRTLRVIPILMLLIDGGDTEPIDIQQSVFKSKAINISELQQLFKRHPVLPLYADINITVMNIFDRSVHFNIAEMGYQWGATEKEKIGFSHTVTKHWPTIKEAYDQYSNQLMIIRHKMDKNKFTKTLDPDNPPKAAEIYDLIKMGLYHISDWNGLLCRVMAWKFTHPASTAKLEEIGANLESAGLEYERLIKYNFTKMEVSMFSDIVSMIKSTAASLDKLKADAAPIIRFHVHWEIQQLVQSSLLPILHRMDKRGSGAFEAMLRLRKMNADWLHGTEPVNDIKEYSKKKGLIRALHPARVVGPDYYQLQILRTELRAMYDQKSVARQKVGFFGKSDLKKEDIDALEKFYSDSYFYPYMLNFGSTLKEVSDLSYLWYRELYLDATKCVQFTIDMSLPWLLTEHVIQNQAGMIPVIENMFYTLDIYNDAAYRALYVLDQQHLYNEIEAEMNLVFDQFVIQLAEGVYSHFKDMAAYYNMDCEFKDHLEQSGVLTLKFAKSRLEIPISQRRIHILGRSIDLNHLVCLQINNLLQEDVSCAVSKFESLSITGVIEYCLLIKITQDTHEELSKFMTLDPFDTIMGEINGSMNPNSIISVVNAHIVKCISGDLFPNYVFNAFTGRFVEPSLFLRSFECEKAPRLSSKDLGYGRLCQKSFENYCKITGDCFTSYHLNMLVSLRETYCDMPFIVNSCLSFIYTSLQELQRYNEQLQQSIPIVDIPCDAVCSEVVLEVLENKLRPLLNFTQLKKEVFQIFKEIGNVFSFVQMLSGLMETKEQKERKLFTFLNDTSLEETLSSAFERNLKSRHVSERLSSVIKNGVGDEKTGNVLEYFVRRVMGHLRELGLRGNWEDTTGGGERSKNKKQSPSRILPYHRMWSVLLFLYTNEGISEGTPSDVLAMDDQSGETTRVSNEDLFGHGFLIGGTFLLHLMNQQEKFEMYDLTSLLVAMNTYEMQTNESMNSLKEIEATKTRRFFGGGGSKAVVDSVNSEQLQKRDDFVLRGTFCKLVINNTMDLLNACHIHADTIDASASNGEGADSGDNFLHPPSIVEEF